MQKLRGVDWEIGWTFLDTSREHQTTVAREELFLRFLRHWITLLKNEEIHLRCILVFVHSFFTVIDGSQHELFHQQSQKGCVVQVTAELGQSGMSKSVYKSDCEPSIRALRQSEVRNIRGMVGPVKTIFEEVDIAEYREHAGVDRSIWEVQSIARHFVS